MRRTVRVRGRWLKWILGAAAAVSMFGGASCVGYKWRPAPLTDVSIEKELVPPRLVRIGTDSGVVTLRLAALQFPYVTGRPQAAGGLVSLDIGTVTRLEALTVDRYFNVLSSREVDLDAFWRDPGALSGGVYRFWPNATVLRSITPVDGLRVQGVLLSGFGPLQVDLRNVRSLEVQEVNGAETAVRMVFVTAAVVGAVALIVALTKESCPFVYVDRGNGWELVGEAYAGAAFRSTQRDDLLPLPALGSAGSFRLRLRNEARETQYTDEAKVVLVDSDPSVRVLSTHDQRVLLASATSAPLAARDQQGVDRTLEVSARDDRLWETDPEKVAQATDDQLEEVLTAEFSAPVSGTPVLELVAGNTAWLDLTFGRFFAAMGDRLEEYLGRGNAPEAGPGIRRWREREGVDLRVEVRIADEWRRVAVVQTVGPVSLREIAVPLPADAAGPDGKIHVRVRSGLGFWRVDRLALSTEQPDDVTVHRIAPRAAIGTDGSEQRDQILATDGSFNVLSEIDAAVDLDFELPPVAEGRVRHAFLFSNGWYNVHPPLQSRWQPIVLRTLRDEPGALARFGRDLAREYARRVEPTAGKAAQRSGSPR